MGRPKKNKAKNKAGVKLDKRKEILIFFYIAGFVFIILLTMINIQNLYKPQSITVLGASTEIDHSQLNESKKYWEELVTKHPTYYEGWMELYKIHLTLGDYKQAQNSYEIARRIDFNR